MKKPNDYINSVKKELTHWADDEFDENELIELIKQIQKDTIIFTLNKAAENAKTIKKSHNYNGYTYKAVDKNSILQLEDSLLKTL